jgi:hypothetical protein
MCNLHVELVKDLVFGIVHYSAGFSGILVNNENFEAVLAGMEFEKRNSVLKDLIKAAEANLYAILIDGEILQVRNEDFILKKTLIWITSWGLAAPPNQHYRVDETVLSLSPGEKIYSVEESEN